MSLSTFRIVGIYKPEPILIVSPPCALNLWFYCFCTCGLWVGLGEDLSSSVCVLEEVIRCRGGFRVAQAIESWAMGERFLECGDS